MTVADDGAGFDAGETFGAGHIGLAGMKARIEQIGGEFSITSKPAHGTVVCVAVTLNKA